MSSLEKLLDIMATLRDPEKGCPWDKKQSYSTIVPYTIEETYEVADAIQRNDMDDLRNELGDLLFQVVFYAQIAKEEGHFEFEDVITAINDKMVRRHPHVFANETYANDAELKEAWESNKSKERAEKSDARPSQMDGIAVTLPALIRAEKLQKRAKRVGFEWPDVSGAVAKTYEELLEVEEAIADGDSDHIEDELGDLLFASVNIVRMLSLDAEQVMARANRKFENRFRQVEDLLASSGHSDMREVDLDTMEAAWNQIKHKEQQSK